MSNHDHRAEAENALALIMSADNPAAEVASASEATAHALLAIEARLGQLVEQQQIANALEALQHPGVVENLDEHRVARAKVRRLLGLSNPEGA